MKGLEKIRKARKLSRRELSILSGVSEKAIRGIERESTPTIWKKDMAMIFKTKSKNRLAHLKSALVPIAQLVRANPL